MRRVGSGRTGTPWRALAAAVVAVVAALSATTATAGGEAASRAGTTPLQESSDPCRPYPESLGVSFTFDVSGSRVDDEDHSTLTFEWAQSITVRGTLFSEWNDGVYDIATDGSNVSASGSLAHTWNEVYKKTDLTGEGGTNGGTLDPASNLRVLIDGGDDGTCRFLASYTPRFTGAQIKFHYSNEDPRDSVGSEGFGGFTVHGELDDEWAGRAGASGTIPGDTTDVMVDEDELSGPGGTSVSVELAIGDVPLSPSTELTVEHLDVPSLDDWVEVPPTGTFEGNVVRLTARVDNPSDAATAEIEIRDETEDRTIAGPIHVAVEPGENEYQWELPTEGLTWDDDGERAPDLDLRLTVDIYGYSLADGATLAVQPRPVVLVHGWNSDASGWDGYADLLRAREPDWEVHAVGDGAFAGTMQTGSIANPLDRGLGLAGNAEQLGTYVESLREELDVQRVDIVAHSMGGLISRYYVAALMEIPNGTPVATRLLMLGTPNLGSPCASIIPHSSAFDLDPEVAAQFNAAVRATYGVQLAILAGDSWPTTCHVAGEGDMVVPVTSAFGLPYVTDRHRSSTDHVSMTSSADDARSYVLPRLTAAAGGGRGSGDGSSTTPASFVLPAQAETPTNASPMLLAAGIGELSGRDTIEIPVLVDALDQIGTTITAPAGVTVELVPPTSGSDGPEGNDPEAAAVAASTDDEHTLVSTDVVAAPAPGTWTLRLTSESSGATDVAYAVIGHGTSSPALDVAVSDDAEMVIGVVGAAEDANPIVGAVLVDAKGRSTTLTTTATDDGRHTVALASVPDGSTVVVTARTDTWTRTVRHPVIGEGTFDVPEREVAEPVALVTPPEAVTPMEVDSNEMSADLADSEGNGGGGLPVLLLAAIGLVVVGAGTFLVIRRRSSAGGPSS